MKKNLRLLLPVCLFLSGIFTLNLALASPVGASTGNPAGTEAPPVLITYTWTGAVSTDWHDPNNWSPVGTPLAGSLVGDDVVIPVVGSGNYPVVTALAGARSISIAVGASLNVNAGGTLNVIASASDGVTNAGTLTNAGTMRVDSSFNDGIVNLANALLENSGSLTIIEGTGNRLENYGTVTNTAGTFTVDGGLGTGLINHPGATITNSGGTFRVQNGMARRVDNYGTITNAATFLIEGAAAGEGLFNRAGASIANNGGSFTVQNGTDKRVDNYGTITNAATFTIGGAGAGAGLLNQSGAQVLNHAGTFSVLGGLAPPVENDSRIENSGTFTIFGNTAGETLINRDTIINQAGATFTVQGSSGRILKNSKYVRNSGTMNLAGAIPFLALPELVINELGAMLFNDAAAALSMGGTGATRIFTNHGTFQNNGRASLSGCPGPTALFNSSTGVVVVQDSMGIGNMGPGGHAIVNENSFTLGANGKLNFSGSLGGGSIHNKSVFVSNAGCRLTTSSMGGSSILNDAGAVFTNNCSTTFGSSGANKIVNNGRYTHLNGSMNLIGGHTGFMQNNGYAELDIPFPTLSPIVRYFFNSDTLILGDQCIFPHQSGINRVFENTAGAYLYSDAKFSFENMSDFLDNKGKAILGPSSRYVGRNLSPTNVISNTDTLIMQGEIQITRFFGYGIENTGYVEQSGSFKSTNTNRGILNNGGTFLNSGSLQLDSIANNALLLQGAQSFTNTSTGTISMTFIIGDGIRNEADGNFLNEGEIAIGTQDTMGLSGIVNQAMFTNKNRIKIGAGGVEFGLHGIHNAPGGNFLNRGTIDIGVQPSTFLGDGIRNEQTFTNDYCAEINLHENLYNSDVFDNNGVLNINTDQAHTNTGTFTNRGTINFLQPGSIPGVINDPFILICPDDLPICQYASPLDLSTLSATPAGGTYSGTGVSGNMFNPTTAGPGMHTITYAYTQYDGCASTCTFKIEVIAAPGATATPSPESICSGDETDIALSSAVPGTTFTWVVQSTSGNVSGQADGSGNTIAQTLSVNDGNPGTVVYRITPTGPAPHFCVGQTTDVTVNVTISQITSITCPGPVTVSCLNNVPAPNPAAVSATDLCGKPIVSKTLLFVSPPYDVECLNRFKLTRWYQATSSSGNTASCSQVITVLDNTQPNFTSIPANVTVQCNSIPVPGMPTATDNCGGAVTVTYNGQTVSNQTCADGYTLTRQWTATDACGNTRTATQRINVIDSQRPAFVSTPANVTVQCDAIPAPTPPTATDNCASPVAITYIGETRTNGTCLNRYTLTRRWVASDNCGNTVSVSQRITVVDNNAPTLTIPANTTIACNDPIPPVGSATATDGCVGNVTVTYLGQTTANNSCPGTYQIRRTWRATDVCGNSTVATQTIQVSDNGAPVFTSVPADVTIQCNQPLPPLQNPTATDACGGFVQITFLGNVPSGSGCAQDYTVTRTWRAQDLCGNTALATQVITVQGNSYGEEGAEDRTEDTPLKTQNTKLVTVNPNPTTDRIWLDLTDFTGEAITISIFSDLGSLIWENRLPAVEDLKLSVSLRAAGAAAGTYTVRVLHAGGITTSRLILVE